MECPCENCIVLAICKSIDHGPLTIFELIDHCSILKEFLQIRGCNKFPREIRTDLTILYFKLAIREINKFLNTQSSGILIAFYSFHDGVYNFYL